MYNVAHFQGKTSNVMRLLKFIKDWILIFSILSGVAGYFLCHAAHLCTTTHNLILRSVETV